MAAAVSQEATAADGPEKDINWRLIFSRSSVRSETWLCDPNKKLFPSSIADGQRGCADLHKFKENLLDGVERGEGTKGNLSSSMNHVKLSLRPA